MTLYRSPPNIGAIFSWSPWCPGGARNVRLYKNRRSYTHIENPHVFNVLVKFSLTVPTLFFGLRIRRSQVRFLPGAPFLLSISSRSFETLPKAFEGLSLPPFLKPCPEKARHPEFRREENKPDQRLTLTTFGRERCSLPNDDKSALSRTRRESDRTIVWDFSDFFLFWKEGFPPCRRKIQENYDWEKLF